MIEVDCEECGFLPTSSYFEPASLSPNKSTLGFSFEKSMYHFYLSWKFNLIDYGYLVLVVHVKKKSTSVFLCKLVHVREVRHTALLQLYIVLAGRVSERYLDTQTLKNHTSGHPKFKFMFSSI